MTIPPSVTSIGGWAFFDCNGLTSVTIPSSVTSIGGYAFYYCSGLMAVDFEGAPPAGLVDANVIEDTAIRYNIAYEDEWLPVIEACGFANATAYEPEPQDDPNPPGQGEDGGMAVAFVAADGEISCERSTFATNGVYGVMPEARRDGFTFAGWYTAFDGGERVGAFSEVDPSITTLYARWVEDDASLYAQWAANAYSVNFFANGGVGAMEGQQFLYDQIQALSGNGFTRAGYTFKGWATSADGKAVYADAEVVSNLTAEAGFAVALFAQWEWNAKVETTAVEDWVYETAGRFAKPGESKLGYCRRFEERFGDDYAAAFFRETGKVAADGTRLCVWHDYVAGTDPLDEKSQFKATVRIGDDGTPIVEFEPKLSAEEAALRIYKTYGKKSLNDGSAWEVVPEGKKAAYNFFKVTVEMR